MGRSTRSGRDEPARSTVGFRIESNLKSRLEKTAQNRDQTLADLLRNLVFAGMVAAAREGNPASRGCGDGVWAKNRIDSSYRYLTDWARRGRVSFLPSSFGRETPVAIGGDHEHRRIGVHSHGARVDPDLVHQQVVGI